jgi:hypothetical protein
MTVYVHIYGLDSLQLSCMEAFALAEKARGKREGFKDSRLVM